MGGPYYVYVYFDPCNFEEFYFRGALDPENLPT